MTRSVEVRILSLAIACGATAIACGTWEMVQGTTPRIAAMSLNLADETLGDITVFNPTLFDAVAYVPPAGCTVVAQESLVRIPAMTSRTVTVPIPRDPTDSHSLVVRHAGRFQGLSLPAFGVQP